MELCSSHSEQHERLAVFGVDPSEKEQGHDEEADTATGEPKAAEPPSSSSHDSDSSIREVRDVADGMTNPVPFADQETHHHPAPPKSPLRILQTVLGLTDATTTTARSPEIPLADAIRSGQSAQTSAARRRMVHRFATFLFTVNALAGIVALVMFWRMSGGAE